MKCQWINSLEESQGKACVRCSAKVYNVTCTERHLRNHEPEDSRKVATNGLFPPGSGESKGVCMGGGGGDYSGLALGTYSPISFIFMQFSVNFLPNTSLALLPVGFVPPLGNPGSACFYSFPRNIRGCRSKQVNQQWIKYGSTYENDMKSVTCEKYNEATCWSPPRICDWSRMSYSYDPAQ